MRRPALFFDRDGVVNSSPGPGAYVTRFEDFQLLEGISEVLAWGRQNGFWLVLVTNQQIVGKGGLSRADLDALHGQMQEKLGPQAQFDLLLVCPHLKDTCTCRKPLPGMIQQACAALAIDLERSWLIGDQDRDIQLAKNAGIAHSVHFQSEKEVREAAEFCVASHAELLRVLQSH